VDTIVYVDVHHVCYVFNLFSCRVVIL